MAKPEEKSLYRLPHSETEVASANGMGEWVQEEYIYNMGNRETWLIFSLFQDIGIWHNVFLYLRAFSFVQISSDNMFIL